MTTIAAPEWFAAALESLRAGDIGGYVQIYDDDAVHEFPFAPGGRPPPRDTAGPCRPALAPRSRTT